MILREQPVFVRLLALSPLSAAELTNLIETAPSRYKDHTIVKRNGRGVRWISQPTAELKYFQRILVTSELNDLPIHDSAKAYRIGGSIRDHALPHARSRYVLKLDFRDFFPSIRASTIRQLLRSVGRYSDEEQLTICRLLCRRKPGESSLRLSIGAPSSPFISNAVMFDFDCNLAQYCIEGGVIYTRYADDIALSTSESGKLRTVEEYVRYLLRRMWHLRLSLNETKTVNVSRKYQRILTGLVLANDGNVSIGRDKKRQLRAVLHQLSEGRVPQMSPDRLRGMLAFLYSVDPRWVLRTCRRFGFESIASVSARLT